MISIDKNKLRRLQTQQAERDRAAAYVAEADPLFFKTQRGEATVEEWQAKVEEIRQRYPYPEPELN